ncbi:MAG TPA: 2-oxoglutarate dehydrogenase complex dihydrolipoyllysine-residue succinyltransferase [Terriglobia bacterium]|nr:2-oxoglutarate dehydrogenase complex dihydrolipoyllysine-residue succinyltransferase [Terriglobia bacterium]
MAVNIVVPELGESVIEATVGRWLKKEGDPVSVGEVVVELETDKVDLEVGAERAGVLSRIERKEGEDVKIGEVLGLIEDAGARESRVGTSESGTGQPRVSATISAGSGKQELKLGESKIKTATGTGVETRTPSPETRTPAFPATPSARRLAREHDVDLAKLAEGNGGARLTKDVVESHLKPATPTAAGAVGDLREPPSIDAGRSQPATVVRPIPAGQVPGAVTEPRGEERVRMSRRRQTIARRLVEAQHTAAMLTTFNEVDMTAVMELRKRHRESFKERYGIGLGIVSFFVKASIAVLRSFPRLNAEIQGDEMVLKRYYDIGIAVGASEGLVVPVLRDADRMSFAQIESAIKAFAEKAEDGTLTLDDLRGGTFTISNGGVFGSLLSTPILNPPQVGILGLHRIMERPVTVLGAIASRPMMYLALSYDHRIVDGLEAVQFLVKVKQLVEDPGGLLLEG